MHGTFEEVLTPESTLPVQFERMWHGRRALSPERKLAMKVLHQAAEDLQKYRCVRRRTRRRLYDAAYDWVVSDDRAWPYSFVNICEALNLSVEALRAELLAENTAKTAA